MNLMRKMDTNKDGFLTMGELVDGLRDLLGIKLTQGEQAALMKHIDDNGDGHISYDELYKALSTAN